MNNLRVRWRATMSAAAVALLLAACGGGDGDQTPRVAYGKLVSFGDSLSDVGSYAVGFVAASGGGKYTINGPEAKNWTELLAAQMGVAAPCAAQTGLNAAASLGGPVAVQNHPGCYGYAQGGARVTDPIGPGNAALLAVGDPQGALGQLTDPILNQITRHLATSGGAFDADDLVTVMGGGNDLLMNLAAVAAGQATPTQALTAMGVAGAEQAGYIKAMILAKGAQRVVVVNLPDASQTPSGATQTPEIRGLIQLMASTFNDQLNAGLATEAKVLVVDAFTSVQDEVAHPAQYALSNATTPACDLDGALAALPTSLVCSAATLIPGDVSAYLFADGNHLTPYGYRLLAQLVTNDLAKKGWL